MLLFMQKKEREKRKTEKTAPQNDNSHLEELYLGFVKNNNQESWKIHRWIFGVLNGGEK